MRIPRFRLRSLMILVLLSSLVLAGVAQLLRMEPIDFVDLRDRFLLLAPFLLLVVLKTGIVITARWKRGIAPEHQASEARHSDAPSS